MNYAERSVVSPAGHPFSRMTDDDEAGDGS
jgi:hypothetical protein